MASLNEYTGSWTKKHVVHLLKRTTFGAKPSDITAFASKTLSAAVDDLIKLKGSAPAPPLNHYEGADNGAGGTVTDPDGVAKGSTWVNGTYGDGTVNFLRAESMKFWWIKNMINQESTIEEKMVLFWHHLLITQFSSGGGATAAYRLMELFRTYAFGNLPTLLLEVTKNPQMLHYLNGFLNTKYSPDENYGRELQELFSVGKGPDSKYTEDDVKMAAKVLTGHSLDWNAQTHKFYDTLHDTGNKTFSGFYNNTTVTGKTGASGADELVDLISMITATTECSRFIIRRVYRFFVNHNISADVETNIIQPLATAYKANGYNLQPILKTLFKSEHFFESGIMGCQIKSPVDHVVGFCREGNITQPSGGTIDVYYKFLSDLYYTIGLAQQLVGDAPNVAGWPAYYQEPGYYQIWINSDTLPKRVNFLTWILYNGYNACFSPIQFAQQFSNPGDPDALIEDMLQCMYVFDILPTTKSAIKSQLLLNGLTLNSYWTSAWTDYVNNPTDADKKNVVESRLRNLVLYFCQSPHYQMC